MAAIRSGCFKSIRDVRLLKRSASHLVELTCSKLLQDRSVLAHSFSTGCKPGRTATGHDTSRQLGSGPDAQPINALTSMGDVQPDGATPMAITNATMPSIRPRERFLVSFLFPAASLSTTLLAAHMLRTG
jgi:hypothetical protein